MGLKSRIVVSVLGNRPGRLGRLDAGHRLQGPAGYLQLFRQPGGIGAADLPYLGECRTLGLVRSENRPCCLPVLSSLDVSTQPRDQFLVITSDAPPIQRDYVPVHGLCVIGLQAIAGIGGSQGFLRVRRGRRRAR